MSRSARSPEIIGTVDAMTSLELADSIDASVDAARRRIKLTGAQNFRDLGGYELGDGRRIRYGRLFRADGLANLTDHDLDVVDALGIRTVIDLRSSRELDERGRFPVERHPVSFHHLPIVDATWADTDLPPFDDTPSGAVEFLVWAYRDMLVAGADRFAHAMSVLALAGTIPAVFHCAAGKDRTGLLAMLVLGGLGVDDDVIAADFALTASAMERMRGWIEANAPESFATMNQRPSFMFSSDPAAIRQILADLRADHGSVAGYLSSIGVGSALLADLADQLTA